LTLIGPNKTFTDLDVSATASSINLKLTSAANLPLKWSSSLAIYFIFLFKKYNLELGLQTLGTLRVFKRVIEIQY
jgi:hypothetical protein